MLNDRQRTQVRCFTAIVPMPWIENSGDRERKRRVRLVIEDIKSALVPRTADRISTDGARCWESSIIGRGPTGSAARPLAHQRDDGGCAVRCATAFLPFQH